MDAIDALRTLLPMNIMVVAFDFSGCGLSEGEYISLGYYEKEDIKVLVEHLRERELTTRIALWGRSMGAATALQYAATDPSLACIVCDSVFSSLQTLASELVGHFGIDVPGLMIKIVFNMVRNSVKKRAKFDIKYVLSTLSHNTISQYFTHRITSAHAPLLRPCLGSGSSLSWHFRVLSEHVHYSCLCWP